MRTILTTQTKATWFLIARDPEPGMPARIPVNPPFRVGRKEGSDLCLDCRNVSGLHAELTLEDEQLKVEDLNSTNGTFVNEVKIHEQTVLSDGDTLRFGISHFTVSNANKRSGPMPTLMMEDSVEAPQETIEDRFARLVLSEIIPHFQPVFDITGISKARIGFEVLGRSRLFGLKTPDHMFAVAADLKRESELSGVLRMRGIQTAANVMPPEVKLFVNTHPAELDGDNIERSLKLIRSRYPARQVMLELPEMVLYEPEQYKELLRIAGEQNIKLALYNFGAGQIRLTELHSMNPDVVKIDCALTQKINHASSKQQTLVSAMVKMMKELGIAPMAQLVETEAEHNALKQLGFELAQGLYYGRPSSIDDIKNVDSKYTLAKVNETPKRPLANLKSMEFSAEVVVRTDRAELASELAEKDYKDSEWLLQQDPESLTLQLMFTSKADGARNFVAQQEQSGDFAIYRKWSSKREWFVVTYGVYNDRGEAKADTQLFESSEHTTWVRKMAEVHTEVRSIEDAD